MLADLIVACGVLISGFRMLRSLRGRAAGSRRLSSRSRRARLVRVRTIDDRIRLIQRQIARSVVDPEVRKRATAIVAARCGTADPKRGVGRWCIEERDYEGELAALYRWVRAHVRYTGDVYGVDTYQSARRTLRLKAGDCDDYTILIAALASSIGYPVKLKTIRFKRRSTYGHIYPVVGVPPSRPSKWVAMDASVDEEAGWEVPKRQVAQAKLDRAWTP